MSDFRSEAEKLLKTEFIDMADDGHVPLSSDAADLAGRLTALHEQEVARIVGKDDKWHPITTPTPVNPYTQPNYVRNELRAEQRTRAGLTKGEWKR